MLWWVFILAPGTMRLVWDVLKILGVAFLMGRWRRLSEIRVKISKWYMEFARLDPRTMEKFERFQMSKKTEYRVMHIRA